MEALEKYLRNKEKRLLVINSICYIKRVYTDNGVVFECVKEPMMLTTKDINEIRE